MKSIALLIVLISTGCSYDYTLINKTSGKPMPNVKVKASFWLKLPSIGHPAEFEVQQWVLETDQKGQFSITSIWGEPLITYYKKGYERTSPPDNVKINLYSNQKKHYMKPIQ